MEGFWFFWRKHTVKVSILILLAFCTGLGFLMEGCETSGKIRIGDPRFVLCVGLLVFFVLAYCLISVLLVFAWRDNDCPKCCRAGASIVNTTERQSIETHDPHIHAVDDYPCPDRTDIPVMITTITYQCSHCGNSWDRQTSSTIRSA